MAPLRVSCDIVPLGEFKAHASQWVRRLRKERGPFVITQNGRPAAVLVSPEEYDELQDRAQFLSAAAEGLSDSEAGRTISDEELTAVLDARYGPGLP